MGEHATGEVLDLDVRVWPCRVPPIDGGHVCFPRVEALIVDAVSSRRAFDHASLSLCCGVAGIVDQLQFLSEFLGWIVVASGDEVVADEVRSWAAVCAGCMGECVALEPLDALFAFGR